MSRPKYLPYVIFICLIVLSIVLLIPKSIQINAMVESVLSSQELDFFKKHQSFFIILIIFLELLGTLITIYFLKYVYIFSKIKLSMWENANIYLISNVATKIFSLLLPYSLKSFHGIFNGLFFMIVFALTHYLYNNKTSYNTKQWLILSIYPGFNLMMALL